MKDIHSHLLYEIDDGAKSIEESIKILEEMSKRGVTDIVLTPHYVLNSRFSCSPEKKREKFNLLKAELTKKDINVNLYLGNEIFLNEELLKYLNNKEIDTINNSKYILVEFSLYDFPINAEYILSELIYNGYRVILAHPERYSYMKDNIEFFNNLREMGVLFQCNYESLFNKYGSYAKKNLKYLLKNNCIEFLAGDIHHSVTLNLKKLKRKLKRYISEEKIEDILNNNFDKVINNEEILIK